MPLRDHFQPPLSGHRRWEGFHGWWAAALAGSLNERLPPEYFAEFRVKVGTRVEIDGTFTEDEVLPTSTAVVPALFPDDFAVHVFSNIAGPTLVAAMANFTKDNGHADNAEKFTRAQTYLTSLQQGAQPDPKTIDAVLSK